MIKPVLTYSFDQLPEKIKNKLKNEYAKSMEENQFSIIDDKLIYKQLKKFRYFENGCIVWK